jgi:ubiquinone/menaquinone biosynthesis C-methylase UbiE
MTTQQDILQAEYRQRFTSAKEYRDRVWKTLCTDFFELTLPADAAVLDVGCGWGEFSNNFKARKKFAMDLNPDARERLNPEVEFLHQDCSQSWPVAPGSLDCVFSSNFLEHLPSKELISKTLAEAYKSMKTGGSICLVGPNIRFVPGEYWDFWDHHIALSERSVSEALQLAGFNVELCVDKFLPYTMSDGKRAPIAFVSLYLKLPFLWRFFGKQFLVIARK